GCGIGYLTFLGLFQAASDLFHGAEFQLLSILQFAAQVSSPLFLAVLQAPGVLPAIRPENYPADTLCRISFAGLPQRTDAGHPLEFVGHTAVPISGEGGSIRIRPCSSAFLPACI